VITSFGKGRVLQLFTQFKYALVLLDEGLEYTIEFGENIRATYPTDGVSPIRIDFDDILSLAKVDDDR